MSSYFKCLIYKITLKVHKFVVHNLVNFVFFAYLCIRNQVKRNSNGKGIRIWYVGCRKLMQNVKVDSLAICGRSSRRYCKS